MKKFVLTFAFLGLILSGCKKEGCTDDIADNYDKEAKKDDGSCTYKAGVVFYWDADTYDYFLFPAGYYDLDFYVNGTIIGTISGIDSWDFTYPPSCNEFFGSIHSEQYLGTNKTGDITYTVKDSDTNDEIWTGSTTLTAGTCKPIKLE